MTETVFRDDLSGRPVPGMGVEAFFPVGRIARGISAPGLHGSVRNSLPLHGSCRPGHLAAGFTQAQCAKYCGRLSAASVSIRVAFFQVLRFLYLFMTHRSK